MAMMKTNILLIGPMGAGKSTVGTLLAQSLNYQFYDVDKKIEERAGVDIPQIFATEGESGFRKREAEMLAELTALTGVVLATGGGAILAVNNRKLLASRGIVIYLQVSLEQQLVRVDNGQGRPLLNNTNIAERLQKLQIERGPLYLALANHVVNTDNLSPNDIVNSILNITRTKITE